MKRTLTASQRKNYLARLTAKRAKRREDGKCPECGAIPEDAEFKLCRRCRRRKDSPIVRKRRRLIREVFLKNGYCGSCYGTREVVPGTTRCAVCAELADGWIVQARAKAVKAGKCPLCLNRPVSRGLNSHGKPWKSCLPCRTRARKAKEKLEKDRAAAVAAGIELQIPTRKKAA